MDHISKVTPEGLYAHEAREATIFDGCPEGWVRADPPEGEGTWQWVGFWTLVEDTAPFDQALLDRLTVAECALIDEERDRRIDGGFAHDGHSYQSRISDRENITRKGDRADKAISAGAVAGDYTWDVTTEGQPFVWIAADNVLVPMDAFQMQAMRDAGEKFKQATTFYARTLKDTVIAATSQEAKLAVRAAATWPT